MQNSEKRIILRYAEIILPRDPSNAGFPLISPVAPSTSLLQFGLYTVTSSGISQTLFSLPRVPTLLTLHGQLVACFLFSGLEIIHSAVYPTLHVNIKRTLTFPMFRTDHITLFP